MKKTNIEIDSKEKIQKRALLPTNDFIFNKIFGNSENIESTKNLISSLTNQEISSIELYENEVSENDIESNKSGLFNVEVFINNEFKICIAMQTFNEEFIEKKIINYWCQTLLRNETMDSIKKTKALVLFNFENTDICNDDTYITKYKLLEQDYPNISFTDYFEINILELPKIEKLKNIQKVNNDLLLWTKFLTDPDSLTENEIKNNIYIKKSKEKLDIITKSEHDINLAKSRFNHLKQISV